jgi:pimeloyl-ACP methyl ester carboxylesterase
MRKRVLAALVLFVIGIAAPASAQEIVDGRFGPGALYRMVRPANWNGSLVLFAHGIVPTSAPVALPPEGDIVAAQLAPRGFAVAYTSYSENGWAVKDGAQRTHQLLGTFASHFGQPSRVYLFGLSMGALIQIKLLEQHAGAFDGALLGCAASGGTRALFDYQAHVRALFDFFYPGVLPGNAGSVPAGINLVTQIFQPALLAMQSNPLGAQVIASIDQTPVPATTPAELAESIVTALVNHAGSFTELSPLLNGKPYFENRDIVYTSAVVSPVILANINALVGRFKAAPSALNYIEHYYQPSGRLEVPMLMVSTSRDPDAPGFNQTLYRELVTASGDGNQLVQRTFNRYGHCALDPTELATAFGQLVAWVELGIKPAP